MWLLYCTVLYLVLQNIVVLRTPVVVYPKLPKDRVVRFPVKRLWLFNSGDSVKMVVSNVAPAAD